MAPRLRIDGRTFRDADNREVILHGINCAADAKFPATPDIPSHVPDRFFDGDHVSFVNRPFSVQDAPTHFARLRSWGYNTIRYIFTWEAIEHAGPGIYDEEWIDHTVSILRKAKEYGFYIFMDPHQDVWSRFSGGSGAPMWTLYACGLDPEYFAVTEAAIVQNTFVDPSTFPKMIWATNYTRMVCQVMYTLFFGGKDFAPKAIIDGKNIQDYLQDHFIGACQHLAKRIHEAGDLWHDPIVGWESMNEPNRGLISYQDITVIPAEQKLQKGTSPTAWQAILTGSGRACEIATWEFGGMGPYKSGTALIDPKGKTAWLSADHDDSKYGWTRDAEWQLGECIWAQHGVWDPATDTVLRKDYFGKDPKNGATISYEYFTNHYWLPHYRKYSKMVKAIFPDSLMFFQPPVMEIPPSIKGTEDDDANIIFSPHFYDGITLLTKKWNRVWNIDVFGVLRGKYLTPALAIKIGETAIRNCFAHQLKAMREEGTEYMGIHPCVFTEIGIPYDMDDKYAYKTGDYSSQISAMDANHFGLEQSVANGFTLWTYVVTNTHDWGDEWNGEDLSIFSLDDKAVPAGAFTPADSRASLDTDSPTFSKAQSQSTGTLSVTPSSLQSTLTGSSMSSSRREGAVRGLRAAEAFIRPTPIAVHGDVSSYGFDLKNCTFKLSLTAPSSTAEDVPTMCYLAEFHFPSGQTSVEASGGKWTITSEEDGAGAVQQILRWWHAEGDQEIKVKGVVRKAGSALGTEEDEGYLQQCQKQTCAMM